MRRSTTAGDKLRDRPPRRRHRRGGSGTSAAGLRRPTTRDASPRRSEQAEKDLAAYEQIFANAEYWKKIGERIPEPAHRDRLDAVHGAPEERRRHRARSRYVDSSGAEQYRSVGSSADQKGYALTPKFVFIDGRTGAQLYSETFHEEALYPTDQNTPALSSYFELMDKLLPSFLNTLSTQKIKGTRILLK